MALALRLLTAARISSGKPHEHKAAEATRTRCAEDSHSAGCVWLGRATEDNTAEPDAGHGLAALT